MDLLRHCAGQLPDIMRQLPPGVRGDDCSTGSVVVVTCHVSLIANELASRLVSGGSSE